MDHVNYFKDLFKSIPIYRKIVLIMFLIENDIDFLTDYGFLKIDNSSLYKECKNILLEQTEEYLEYIKNEEESIIERLPN